MGRLEGGISHEYLQNHRVADLRKKKPIRVNSSVGAINLVLHKGFTSHGTLTV